MKNVDDINFIAKQISNEIRESVIEVLYEEMIEQMEYEHMMKQYAISSYDDC